MDEKVKTDLLRLENLTVEARLLDEEIDEIKARVVASLPVGTKVQAESGTFSVAQRSKWKYTPELEAREKRVKEDQKREQQMGLAQESHGDPYIVYKTSKESENEGN